MTLSASLCPLLCAAVLATPAVDAQALADIVALACAPRACPCRTAPDAPAGYRDDEPDEAIYMRQVAWASVCGAFSRNVHACPLLLCVDARGA